MKTLFKDYLLSTAKAFGRDRSGNFGVIAAVSLTAMIGVIGAAIDIGGATSEKSRLQDITDSAALAASASGETDEKAIRAVIDDVMASHAADGRAFTYNMTLDAENIIVTANSDHETAIMGMFGYKTIPVSTTSGTPLPGTTPVHVSLVVDTTDSMNGANLTSLKKAAGELVEVIERGKDHGAKMAVVPFGEYVNIGMGNRNISWMNVPDDYSEAGVCYMTRPVKSEHSCTTRTETRYRDGVPYDHEDTDCIKEYEDFEVEVCGNESNYTWRGCAGSREAPLNIIAAAASGSTEIPGVMNKNCGTELLPLTDNFKDVEDTIDALTTDGNTYLPSGLIWGWRSLTTETPFATAAAEDNTVRAMVFMTDGGNTMNQDNGDDYPYHENIDIDDTDKRQEAAARMLSICGGIKNDGIKIYTIGYKLPAALVGAGDTLKSCATSPSTAYSAENSKELEQAFEDIGKSLTSVRLKF